MEPKTYDLGPFTATTKLVGMVDQDLAFEVSIVVPKGPSFKEQIKSGAPIPASPTLYVVSDLRRLLKMGIQRFVQFKMMSERRMPEEIRELQKKAGQMYMVALGIPGGDAALAKAEDLLQGELRVEETEFSAKAQEEAASEGEADAGTVRFDLGPIKITVHLAGMIPGERGAMGAFEVAADVPGLPTHVATVASDTPLLSSAAGWYLGEAEKVLQLGPDAYFAANLGRIKGDAEEGRQFAYSLFGIASALGPVGIQHARGLLQQAAGEEELNANEGLIESLEEELKNVRKQIAAIKHKRQSRGGR